LSGFLWWGPGKESGCRVERLKRLNGRWGLVVRNTIHLYDADRILRKAGAERVGEDASQKLCELMEDGAKEVIRKAIILARHAGRNQVTKEDVWLAARMIYAI
jgi:histone H3/H4